jgi:hypothetical protein
MAKKIQSITPPTELTKSIDPIWALLTNQAEQLFPHKEGIYERLAYTCVRYFYSVADAYYFSDFYFHYGISEFYFSQAKKRSPLVAEAHRYAKEIIYRKRCKKLIETDSRFLRWDLHNYSDEVKKNDAYQDERKAKALELNAPTGVIIVREGATRDLDKQEKEKSEPTTNEC